MAVGDVCIAPALVDRRDAQRITDNGVPHQQTGDPDIDNAQISVSNEAFDIRDEA